MQATRQRRACLRSSGPAGPGASPRWVLVFRLHCLMLPAPLPALLCHGLSRMPMPTRGARLPAAVSAALAGALLALASPCAAHQGAGSAATAGPGDEVMTLALYQPRYPVLRDAGSTSPWAGDEAAAAEDPSCRADAERGAAAHYTGSRIPNPLDNPWALGMLAAVLALMTWADWRQRREDRARRRTRA